MQSEFEYKITQLGLFYSLHQDGSYIISQKKKGGNQINVQLIQSLPISKQVDGSKNGNEVQSIGRFVFKLPSLGHETDILSFAFHNTVKDQVEFLIIPLQELLRRQVKNNLGIIPNKLVEMTIWLMEDGCAYDVTNISAEGEWFFLNKGVNGRMADGTDIDFSEYMNRW